MARRMESKVVLVSNITSLGCSDLQQYSLSLFQIGVMYIQTLPVPEFSSISHKLWRTTWCACQSEKLEEWGDRDFMKFNKNKHEVLHIERNSPLEPQGAAVLRGHGGLGREQSEHRPAASWGLLTGAWPGNGDYPLLLCTS